MQLLKFGNMNRIRPLSFITLILLISAGCYTLKWNDYHTSERLYPPPAPIVAVFEKYPGRVMQLDALSPGNNYKYDYGEKDDFYGTDDRQMRFRKVEVRLHEQMPKEKVIVDIAFIDGMGNLVEIPSVDLMRFTPKLDMEGELLYPEYILEELNRFSISFRREHEEFDITLNGMASEYLRAATERAYRASIDNNCLSAAKWEFTLKSESYTDFKTRKRGRVNINQDRLLAHSWFYLDKDLYQQLMELKNPGNPINLNVDYDSLSNLAEQVSVDFEQLREPLKKHIDIRLLEVGHRSQRPIEPLDLEEYYKWQFGLLLTESAGLTYKSVLEQTVRMASYKDEGFYRVSKPKEVDYGWLQYVDSVVINSIAVPGTDCYVEITLTGKWTPYNITIGNIDLAQIDEQNLYGLLFGFNPNTLKRRYNPVQSTISFDTELLPDNIKPYVLMTNKQTGKWVNNQHKGLIRIYLTYETLEKDVLNIYVLSSERITPVWMARVKLSAPVREMVRVRKNLYNY